MKRISRGKRPFKTIAALQRLFTKPKLRALARRIAREERYTLPEIIEMMQKLKKTKRGKGRPARINRNEILDTAAKAKAQQGKYRHVAARFRLTPKQLDDLIQRNRAYFNAKVKQFRNSIVTS